MIANDILPDIDLRYRNTFTPSQKCVWMNDEQNDIYNIFKIESDPISIQLDQSTNLYLRPQELKYIEQIKTATVQISNIAESPQFIELPFRRSDDGVSAAYGFWYTFVGNDKIYINFPHDMNVTGFNVFFFFDQTPTTIVDENSDIYVPTKYLEIMKLGVLRRIAEARKDITMQSNYDGQRNEIISDMTWASMIQEPEWVQPSDMLPRAGRNNAYSFRRWY